MMLFEGISEVVIRRRGKYPSMPHASLSLLPLPPQVLHRLAWMSMGRVDKPEKRHLYFVYVYLFIYLALQLDYPPAALLFSSSSSLCSFSAHEERSLLSSSHLHSLSGKGSGCSSRKTCLQHKTWAYQTFEQGFTSPWQQESPVVHQFSKSFYSLSEFLFLNAPSAPSNEQVVYDRGFYHVSRYYTPVCR